MLQWALPPPPYPEAELDRRLWESPHYEPTTYSLAKVAALRSVVPGTGQKFSHFPPSPQSLIAGSSLQAEHVRNNWPVRLVTSVAGLSKGKTGEGEGRVTEKALRSITLRSNCLLGWGLMKPSGGKKRLGPGQDDPDRQVEGTGASVSPESHSAYRKESSNLSTLRLSIKRKSTFTRSWGPVVSRSLLLGVDALVERTACTHGNTCHNIHFRFTEGFHINHLIWSTQCQ